jgi:hypothetical protein
LRWRWVKGETVIAGAYNGDRNFEWDKGREKKPRRSQRLRRFRGGKAKANAEDVKVRGGKAVLFSFEF